jgi:hypothetical protein
MSPFVVYSQVLIQFTIEPDPDGAQLAAALAVYQHTLYELFRTHVDVPSLSKTRIPRVHSIELGSCVQH